MGHGSIRFSGRSFINVSILSGWIDVSFDSAEFARDRTVSATVAGDGTWTASVQLVAQGPRTIHVALRGANGEVITTAERNIVVTP